MKDLRHESVSDLLRQYKDVLAELKSRKVVRTNNAPLGDLAEKCATYVYRGALEPNSNAVFDLKTPSGECVQVKCRQRSRTTPLSRRFSGIRSLDFDWYVFLLVDGDAVIRASEWSPDDIRTFGTWQKSRRAWSVTVRQFLKNENVGTDRTEDFQNAWCRLLNSTAVDLYFDDDEPDLLDLQMRWAHRYNAYERLANEPYALGELLERPRSEYRSSGMVPKWCGIDLLRGWAFFLVREDHFAGGGTLGREFQDVLATVSRHPEKESGDLPPGFLTT